MEKKSIWKRQADLDELNRLCAGSMVSQLGILFTGLTPASLEAEMPVDTRTCQPFGLLHGGASVTLAETLGSMAGWLVSNDDQRIVGTEINASHHRAVTDGPVRGVCQPLHTGRRQQVWEIVIYDAQNRRCCTCRLTTALVR